MFKKCFMTLVFVLLSIAMWNPVQAKAAVTFEEIPIYVVDDMRDFDQVIGLSWSIDWNLSRDAGVTEQNRYAKFSLPEDSFVRIKSAMVNNKESFSTEDCIRLYGNESMTVPIEENGLGVEARSDDYYLLKAGTYYIQYQSKLYLSSWSQHSTRVMIGAIPESKGVQMEQTVSADRKTVTVTVNQKFATQISKARWCEGKATSLIYQGEDFVDSFTVDKNGWYTVFLCSSTTVPFDKDVEYYAYVNVTGIGEGAKKGVTYKSGNLKYKLVQDGVQGTGTAMVTGMVTQKSSITIPESVKIQGEDYKAVKINAKAFYKKGKLKKITIQSKNITSIGKNAFKGINKKAVFKVPKDKYKDYKKLLTSKVGVTKKMKIKK